MRIYVYKIIYTKTERKLYIPKQREKEKKKKRVIINFEKKYHYLWYLQAV